MDDFLSRLKSRPKPPPPKPLILTVPGATAEQLQAGVAAALAHLEQNGLTPWDVAKVCGAIETWDDDGATEDTPPPDVRAKPLQVWSAAREIAFRTAWSDRPGNIPREAKLLLYEAWE